jgi:GMP synthase (glutamine-hydrolysing)
MKIGILQAGRTPDNLTGQHGDYNQFFERFLGGRGFDFETFAVLDGVFPASVDDADGWLITGSRFGAYEDHDWIPPLEDFLRKAYSKSIPIVGICFGHQILAQALGGKVEKFSGGWSAGVESYAHEGFPQGISLIAWHQDQVTELPADARVVGSSDFCPYAALAYGDRAYTIQPHPEFGADFTYGLIEARREILPEGVADSAEASLGAETSSSELADHIAAFFKRRA